MTWFIAWLVTFGFVVYAGYRIEHLQKDLRDVDGSEHAMCIAHIASVTSNRMVAEGLRNAADKWDSTDEQGNLNRLAREQYKPAGPSMPAIWLRHEANRIEALNDGDDFTGERQ